MAFYCVTRTAAANSNTLDLLDKACRKLKIRFVVIEAEKYDFTKPAAIEEGSCLLNISDDEHSATVFKSLVQGDVATIFEDSFVAINFIDSIKNATIIHSGAGIPIIKTVFDLTRDKAVLKNYADYLGGFPLIIKAEGGSHGIGIIKVDSLESLMSIVDYLVKVGSGSHILRQYIDYQDHARLIVLNNKVIDSVKYHRVPGDFRSNVGKKITIEPKKYSSQVEKIAVEAVKALRAEFGGVDILIDKAGKPFLAEVNVNCYFTYTQLSTGNDIAKQLIQHLTSKAISANPR
jgi:glutathione synthase/RimK-type ligase-like ATP-grasp enzyme